MLGKAHGNMSVLEPEVDFVAGFDPQLVAQLLGDHHLTLGPDTMSHTAKYNFTNRGDCSVRRPPGRHTAHMAGDADLRTELGLVVPARSIEWAFARSGGPGGQHVNTTSSRATLIIDLRELQGSPDAVARVLARIGDELRVSSQSHRSQIRNREDCISRALTQIDAAAKRPPPPRRPTRPTKGSVERRLESKRRSSDTKRGRSGDW